MSERPHGIAHVESYAFNDERGVQQSWEPYQECPCGCKVISHKLQRNGHCLKCACKSCIGRRSRKKGQAAQAKGHRALGGTSFTPTNEESAKAYPITVQVEHKTGNQVPASFRKFAKTEWFRRALDQAERAVRVGELSHPAVMIDGRWLIVDARSAAKRGGTE